MSLPTYPQYKDSGVAWLGQVPAHWGIARLKFAATVQTGIAKGKDNAGKDTIEVPYLRVANVQDGFLVLDDVAKIDVPREVLPRYRLQVGDVLMNEGGDFDKLGRGCIWRGEIDECIHQNHVFAVRPTSVSSEWLNAVTSSAYAQFYFMTRAKQSTNLASISSTNIMELPLVLPPRIEQSSILQFLDRETGKIDALIAEQEQLLTLLAEKRQATISHAVTRGLNPNAPMKDSGLASLGEVPAHWEVGAIKRFFTSLDGKRIPLSAEERGGRQGEFPYYGASGVIDFVDEYIFDEDLVLVSEDGANLLNRSTPIAFVAAGKYWVNNHAHILKPIDGNLSFWAERIEALDLAPVVTGSAQPKLTIEALMNLVIAAPPTSDERAAIATFISTEAAKLDALHIEAKRAIALLKERRSALIAAAVTGKIDVRGAVAHQQEELAA
ncbi:restriction endonuclease subunit S [Cupriavidus sp. TMH.W2]|uniref:restriction endonuclease subunit S n=1 Tax=Cupriavidus sp. TMH.W2 TaxID=3434465 RepID=UPI003D777DC5